MIARISDLVLVTFIMLALLLVRKPSKEVISVGTLLFAALAGVSDIVAEMLYAVATTFTSITLASIIASLYPAMTVLLALIFLKEKPSRIQTAGLIFTLAAVAGLAIL